MRVVIQRVKKAKVEVGGEVCGAIGRGLVIFFAVHKDDVPEATTWLIKKIANLRIFPDAQGKMNLSVQDVDGEALVVSQFTLYGNCMNGRRPDFVESAMGEKAREIYEKFVEEMRQEIGDVQTGIFGALMNISLINEGPVTFIIDGKV